MERKQIYLSDDQQEQLKRLARRKNVTVSSLIREAVGRYLAEQDVPAMTRPEDHPLWRIVGIADGADMPTDGSTNHDAVLYGRPKRKQARR